MPPGLRPGLRKRWLLAAHRCQMASRNRYLDCFMMTPGVLRRLPWVQRLVGGIRTQADQGRVRMTFPGGHVVYCPHWRRQSLNRTIKNYLNIVYLGDYLRAGAPGPGDVVLDVGANVGLFTIVASELVGPRGRVICCEPVPENIACLQLTLQANGITNATVVPAAVGATAGSIEMMISESWGEHSAVLGDSAERLSVPLTTLDVIRREQNLVHVDFVKIDVEGMEREVLLGGAETVRRDVPAMAVSAYHLRGDLANLESLLRSLAPAYALSSNLERAWGELTLYARPPAAAAERSPEARPA